MPENIYKINHFLANSCHKLRRITLFLCLSIISPSRDTFKSLSLLSSRSVTDTPPGTLGAATHSRSSDLHWASMVVCVALCTLAALLPQVHWVHTSRL